jgi:Trk K+ transport system NAD-binding subunit
MAKGSFGLIRLLAIFTLIVILLVAFVVFHLTYNEESSFLSSFWESLSTVINAWMPAYEDGEGSLAYLIPMSLAAIAGLFITSILIGIISSGIEEKINDLKKGHSEILEEDHILVLGFYPGEYTLLKQLVLAADDRACCIVVAGELDQEEMQQYIRDNVEYPKNVRIICRTVDIFDPVALERCALAEARSVIISPTDDFTTTKALLAVSALIGEESEHRPKIGAIVSRTEYQFPPSIAAKHNVTTLQTNETLAKIIAHSCTQPGLSETFRELFNFEGSELYSVEILETAGLRFDELLLRVDRGVPVGIIGSEQFVLNPPGEQVVGPEDKILVFAEDADSPVLTALPELPAFSGHKREDMTEAPAAVTIIGGGLSLDTVLRELPDNVTEVLICNKKAEVYEAAVETAKELGRFSVSRFSGNPGRQKVLKTLAEKSEHIVILSNPDADEETADMDNIFLLLNLRDIRNRFGLSYNITAEMRRESNQNLVATDDGTDFVVASNMSSLFLAQLAESPELIDVFRELLSNEGDEIYLKEASMFALDGEHSVAEIRRNTFEAGYIFLGYIPGDTGGSIYNPPLTEVLHLEKDDQLIVIGKE